MQQITIKTFDFDELSEEAKRKALNNLYDINTDYYWWGATCDELKYRLNEIGINCDRFYWDLDRANYIYMDNPTVTDEKLLLKQAGIDLRTKDAKNALNEGLTIDTINHGGNFAHNEVSEYTNSYNPLSEDTIDSINEVLKDFEHDALEELRNEYEYLSSEEAVIDTIRANEYQFLDDGSREYHI